MNKKLKYLGILALLCFSFYYTNEFASLMRKKDPIYEMILMNKEDQEKSSVDAVVDGDYIIPGLSSKTVNVEKSFQKMKNAGAFVLSYLVYDEEKPSISLTNHKDKIVKEANPLKRGVSLVLPEYSLLQSYFDEEKINYAIYTTKETVEENFYGEKINVDTKNYSFVERKLSEQKENKNLCGVITTSKEFCEKQKKYLFEPTMTVSNSTLANNLSKINSGSILYLENLDLTKTKFLLETISYKGYDILKLSDLISEVR